MNGAKTLTHILYISHQKQDQFGQCSLKISVKDQPGWLYIHNENTFVSYLNSSISDSSRVMKRNDEGLVSSYTTFSSDVLEHCILINNEVKIKILEIFHLHTHHCFL